MPILIVAAFLPGPYNISLPVSLSAGLLFLLSMTLGFMLLVAFSMLIYISAFYTLSPMGIRILTISVLEFFTGAIIPLPFFPESLQTLLYLLPFASIQNTPFQIYNGYMKGNEVSAAIMIQAVWLLVLLASGKLLMKQALRKVVVQGG
jgi:ABC-2 type transport system permease protein